MYYLKSSILLLLLIGILPTTWSQEGFGESSHHGWPTIQFPYPDREWIPSKPGTLVSMFVHADLTQIPNGLVAEATLYLNSSLIPEKGITFYLNPGLEIQSLENQQRKQISYERRGTTIRVERTQPIEPHPYVVLCLKYQGDIRAHSRFMAHDGTGSSFHPELISLSPESLWYPQLPGQLYPGRLRVITLPGMGAWSCVGESKIIEIDGKRTTDFVWHLPIHRLAITASSWKSAQFQKDQMMMEFILPEQQAIERSLLSTLIPQKIDFYNRAFYVNPIERLTLVGNPWDHPAADAAGWILLPSDQLEAHLLGHPWLDRLLARQWFGKLIQFAPEENWVERGWVEYAARLYLEEIFDVKAHQLWKEQGEWLTRLDRPRVSLVEKFPWILRMIRHRIENPAFWELNQEFFQRFLYQQVRIADYLDLAEEILAHESPGHRLGQLVQPWLSDTSIPNLTYSISVANTIPLQLSLGITQESEAPWELELEVEIQEPSERSPSTASRRETILLTETSQSFQFPIKHSPAILRIDPDWKVLCKRTEKKVPSTPSDALPQK